MSLVVVTKQGLREVNVADLDLPKYSRVQVDVGTGDGMFAYRLALENPNNLVIGLDPVTENMRAAAIRAGRKAHRGGVSNLALVRGVVESPPEELVGLADDVFVILPWGRLLEGIVLNDLEVKTGLAQLGSQGCQYRFILNCDIWRERTPVQYADLPEATPEYAWTRIAPEFSGVGLTISVARYLTPTETKDLSSSWARRLSRRRDARFLLLEASRTAG